jgi:hypothetical protein
MAQLSPDLTTELPNTASSSELPEAWVSDFRDKVGFCGSMNSSNANTYVQGSNYVEDERAEAEIN